MAERRHVSIHLAGTVVDVLDNLRVLWDPVMAGIAPPHITLVYPEETVDERSLLVRLSETCDRFGPIRIRIEEFAADNAGEDGVYALVGDPTGCLEALRDELLLPPERSLGFPFLTTVCHPRTSTQGPSCWEKLRGGSVGIDATVSDVVFSTTDNVRRKVIQRFAIAARYLAIVSAHIIDNVRLVESAQRFADALVVDKARRWALTPVTCVTFCIRVLESRVEERCVHS